MDCTRRGGTSKKRGAIDRPSPQVKRQACRLAQSRDDLHTTRPTVELLIVLRRVGLPSRLGRSNPRECSRLRAETAAAHYPHPCRWRGRRCWESCPSLRRCLRTPWARRCCGAAKPGRGRERREGTSADIFQPFDERVSLHLGRKGSEGWITHRLQPNTNVLRKTCCM